MSKVNIYTIDNCPYCDKAKELLNKRGVPFSETKLRRSDAEAVQKIKDLTNMKTFPQILFADKLIGGYSDLAELDASDKLASLL
jgi:glutaredoxin 3